MSQAGGEFTFPSLAEAGTGMVWTMGTTGRIFMLKSLQASGGHTSRYAVQKRLSMCRIKRVCVKSIDAFGDVCAFSCD